DALVRVMSEANIEIRVGEEASYIAVDLPGPGNKDRITPTAYCVQLADRDVAIKADVIVCNADAPTVHKHLISSSDRKKWTDRRLRQLKYSMGLFVFYFGTKRKYPTVQHHTILLGEKYESLLHQMFDLKSLEMSDFSVYLHRPTATDPSLAPEGCDSFYCLVPVPNLQSGIDWKMMGPKYRDLVVDWLERRVLPGLRECITSESYVTPEFYRDELNTLHGTGFSIQPTFGQSAYFRFHNKSEDIANLYFVGAGTHPGAGMPGVLCSAKVLDHIVPSPTGRGSG
ncbi:MAG TPA: phytoene desaturase family protein, partial [Tepidisphaeraceae bacterium]